MPGFLSLLIVKILLLKVYSININIYRKNHINQKKIKNKKNIKKLKNLATLIYVLYVLYTFNTKIFTSDFYWFLCTFFNFFK